MDKENLSWRSFIDVRGENAEGFFGPIADRWNLSGTPMLYLLDHKGVIRHRWLGGASRKIMDEALAKLIKEAEEDGKKGPLAVGVKQARQSGAPIAVRCPVGTTDISPAIYRWATWAPTR
jgi:hypothetical protein